MKYFIVLFSFFFSLPLFSAFPANTIIKTEQSYALIDQISIGNEVACVDSHENSTFNKIIDKQTHHAYHCIIIMLDVDTIVTTPDQKFYCPLEKVFKEAGQLKIGDMLLSDTGEYIEIRNILFKECDQDFFDITVAECHNFFVSRSQVLVHNVISIGIALAFGSGAVEFVSASIGTFLFGTAVGIKVHRDRHNKSRLRSFDNDFVFTNDAQAPGQPTEKDGYAPPKRWDGKKVKNQKTGQYGYPDRDGNIWIPTGPGSAAHGGAHWDVVAPNGTDYDNVYPGGRVRKGRK